MSTEFVLALKVAQGSKDGSRLYLYGVRTLPL